MLHLVLRFFAERERVWEKVMFALFRERHDYMEGVKKGKGDVCCI